MWIIITLAITQNCQKNSLVQDHFSFQHQAVLVGGTREYGFSLTKKVAAHDMWEVNLVASFITMYNM
jgi:hypothetical protein